MTEADEDYLDKEFPKGKTKFRGQAMVLLTLARKEGQKAEREIRLKDELKFLEGKEMFDFIMYADWGVSHEIPEFITKRIEELKKQMEKDNNQTALLLEEMKNFRDEINKRFRNR